MPTVLRELLINVSAPVWNVVRISTGLMFFHHGFEKLFVKDLAMWSQHWWAGIIETVTGLMIALGIQARLGAFLAAGTMAWAYWGVHFSLAEPLPLQNDGEKAVLYCWLFLVIMTNGPGRWTIWPRGDAA